MEEMVGYVYVGAYILCYIFISPVILLYAIYRGIAKLTTGRPFWDY